MTAKGHDDLGFDKADLAIKVFAASFHFARVGVAIIWGSAFHHIGDVYLFSVKVNGCQEFFQKLARGAYKGASLPVLVEARAFPYEHQISVLGAFAGNGIRPPFSKTAIVAIAYLAGYVFKFGHRLQVTA